MIEAQFVALTPYENFVFALKAKESKRHYPRRLDYIKNLTTDNPQLAELVKTC